MSTKFFTMTSVFALTASMATAQDMAFNRIASFETATNNADYMAESSAEIIAATADGMTLVYTDSPMGVIGMIDITTPSEPQPAGTVALNGEPTSVSVVGNVAIVGVNTSESYTAPSGNVVSINLADGTITDSCDLGGQPDSVAIAKDGSFAVIAIENERDEDLGDGRTGQMPAGYLSMVELTSEGQLDCDTTRAIEMTGLAEIDGHDPEPEFVDVNSLGETVVTMQENNHLAIVAANGSIVNHFSAGSVTLENIDEDEEGALNFTATQENVVREPDAVKWIDDEHFATANEGDMDGGSRGWTIWNKDGTVVYESGTDFEVALIQMGHYPEERSGNKGVEPESIEFNTFNGTPMVFVGAERSSAVGVYDVSDLATPVLMQVLPSGIGPEGYVTLPERNLLVSANEVDLIDDGGVRAHVMMYEYGAGTAQYPTLTSAGADELIGWGAISGMVAGENGMVYAVNDSFYRAQPSIFTIDTTQTPAAIVDVTRVTREGGFAAQKLDLEGIALDGEGGFFLASEGRTDRLIPHAIYHVDASGEIQDEIPFPAELLAVERRFGSEGITKIGDTLWIAIQRNWADDDGNDVKLVSYNLETEEWGAVTYPTEDPETGWVGLSEITVHGDYVYLIERDNQIGSNAVLKQITRVSLDQMHPAPLGGDLPMVEKEIVRDLIPDLAAYNGYIVDKVEGLAIFEDGTAFVSTDNDGVDDSSGETFFWSVALGE